MRQAELLNTGLMVVSPSNDLYLDMMSKLSSLYSYTGGGVYICASRLPYPSTTPTDAEIRIWQGEIKASSTPTTSPSRPARFSILCKKTLMARPRGRGLPTHAADCRHATTGTGPC